MKIILSRKGFDSSNGGISSPILEDGTMISFPIPSLEDSDTYEDLVFNNHTYTKILNDLGYKGKTNHCHIDPDIVNRRSITIEGWVPAFGQINSSASYLLNSGVEVGDIFLFFGNFHQVEVANNIYRYVKNTGDFYRDSDIQVIWGYLQIGEIINDSIKQKELSWHPHSSAASINNKTNVIYKAAERLSIDNSLSGAGVFDFSIKRVLTKKYANKATWIKNDVYDVNNIIAKRKNSAKDSQNGIYYAGIWQELVLHESIECEKWARHIIIDD